MYQICLLPGDGIGLEVVPAARAVLEATGLKFNFVEARAGWACFEDTGKSVPDETLAAIKASDACLAGAFTSPKKKVAGFFSSIRYLRRELDLFANLRPAKSRPVAGSLPGIDMLMVRENTEGLYVAQERRYGDLALADVVITRQASERISKVAAEQAQKRRHKLAIIHKANVLPVTSGFFLEIAQEVTALYPDIHSYDLIVDAAAMLLVRDPGQFDVMVTTNLFGDILSDLMAGLVGGLGLAPSANIGETHAIFESVHGSAPDIAGKGIANPVATILSAALMLEHLGEPEVAAAIDQAVNTALSQDTLTPDLGGKATTEEFSNAIIRALG
ncbi:MAG: isocitrate/isopropylmalate dehydrogenase family protein [Trueperaceae bacterium]|nr:isocitrate/isopropylmalate dehydrogenase family protein [Trueperaceae bacterium]